MEGPTPEDFAALEARAAVYDSLDQTKMDKLREEWHMRLPEPYSVAVDELDLTKAGVVKILCDAVEADDSLSPEEKFVLDHEISDRSRTAVLATATEGWND